MVGTMAFALASCANTSSQDEPSTIDEPSESQATQEVETTPTPTPSEEPTPGQDTTPMPNEDEPSEAMPSQEPTSSEPTPTQEPTTTQEPTQSQEPIQTEAPTTTNTPTPTTPPPTSTPIHTHNFKGGDCSTPSICDCGEIGSYGDHNWAYRHIDEVGHYESSGTHMVRFNKCHCGFIVTSDDPNATEVWEEHYFNCGGRCIFGTMEVPNGEDQYVIDTPAHDETYCSTCGAIQ